jgi:uncharacterized protein YgbK (DUF1537 family)
MTEMPERPLVVLDDDPTGVQAVANVPILLDWEDRALVATTAAASPALHLLTNSRALPPEEARSIVQTATRVAVEALARPRLALRGDSTLRGHLLEEYLAVCEAAYSGRAAPLLLVPALPHAGRITLGGVHYLVRNSSRIPLHETEYAADPAFAYRDARLLQWAEDRSHGLFSRRSGREIHLERLRSEGARAVADALLELAQAGQAAVCAPDAETVDDLVLIAQGLRLAEEAGAEVVVRSAPTFVGVLSGTLAEQRLPPPPAPTGLLVVCGSWVRQTTAQLQALVEAYPGTLVDVDVVALASAQPEAEIERAAACAGRLLASRRLAILATPRRRVASTEDFSAGQRIAAGLAETVRLVSPRPAVILAKGGITAAVTARHGLRARRGVCLGPLIEGIALWQLEAAEGTIPYVVFPGNVGEERTLLDVVRSILDA